MPHFWGMSHNEPFKKIYVLPPTQFASFLVNPTAMLLTMPLYSFNYSSWRSRMADRHADIDAESAHEYFAK